MTSICAPGDVKQRDSILGDRNSWTLRVTPRAA